MSFDNDKVNQIYQQAEQIANNTLSYLKQSSKNIEWEMTTEISGWDFQLKIRGTYLNYHSWVYSPSIGLDRAIDDPEYIPKVLSDFGDYALHTTIQQLARKLFEK